MTLANNSFGKLEFGPSNHIISTINSDDLAITHASYMDGPITPRDGPLILKNGAS
ncbi:hypothetical protein EMCG_04060 [[Emmonsia] crescens]|uniref:Uncharacterized protein n=1 Tax=[Emmonsia] crescens TaxID=73230 RepID=A0A0G2J7X4_9EURO|nr:hypothetical protein EMCG_04060 [Emmonsia crescens UAMH 3008]